MPPAREAVAFSSGVLLFSKPWLRTLNKVSDHVPALRNVLTAPIPVTLLFGLVIIPPLESQLIFYTPARYPLAIRTWTFHSHF